MNALIFCTHLKKSIFSQADFCLNYVKIYFFIIFLNLYEGYNSVIVTYKVFMARWQTEIQRPDKMESFDVLSSLYFLEHLSQQNIQLYGKLGTSTLQSLRQRSGGKTIFFWPVLCSKTEVCSQKGVSAVWSNNTDHHDFPLCELADPLIHSYTVLG